VWWLWFGCRAARDEKLAEEPLASADVVAVFPPDGARTVFGDVPVEIVLGARDTGRIPELTLSRGGEDSTLTCALVDGGTVADCGVVPGVAIDEQLTFTLDAGDTTETVATLGRKPSAGIGWSLFDGMSFTTLGGGGLAVTVANDQIANGDCFVALDGYDGMPGAWMMVGGPVTFEGPPDDPTRVYLGHPGFAFLMPTTVGADGTVTGSADTAWLPLELDGQVVHVLLLDVRLTATLDSARLTRTRVEAAIPALGLEELVQPLGGLGAEVLDAVDLDLDRDGDGTPDAATVAFEGEPAPAVIW
jgi:hypothetical protein